MLLIPGVTRVEVIDETGRAYVATGCSVVKADLQDEGRTLKIFIEEEESAC